MKLFVNRNLDASQSLATSLTNNSSQSIPTLFLGDVLDLEICLVDGVGGYDSENANASLKVAIGNLATGTIHAETETLAYNSSSQTHEGVLVLSTQSLADALYGLNQNNFTFEVQMDFGNKSITIFQETILVNNQLIERVDDYLNGSSSNTDTLFAHYKFESISTDNLLADSSGLNKNLSFVGNFQPGQGKYGNCIYFDGSSHSHYHNLTQLSSLSNAYTFSLWIKPDNLNVVNDAGIISYGVHGLDYKQYFQVYQIDKRLVTKSNYISNTFSNSYTFTPDEWVNITLVKESSTTQNLYINGELYFTAFNPNWGNNEANRLNVGKYGNFGFEGFIDDLRIYNKALNGDEVRELYDPNPITKNYVLDTASNIEVGDYIKILTNYENNGIKLNLNEIVSVYSLVGANNIKIKKTNDQTLNLSLGSRGNIWEKIVPPVADSDGDSVPDDQDAFPNDPNESSDSDGDGIGDNADTTFNDADSDGVADAFDYFSDNASYTQSKSDLDAYAQDIHKSFAVGDIFKILQDFTHTEYQGTATEDLKTGDYHIVTATGNQWIRFDVNGAVYQLFDTSRGTKWEIVNPSNSLAPAPPPSDNTYAHFYRQIEKVLYGGNVVSVHSVHGANQELNLDTDSNGTADVAGISYTIGTEYNSHSNDTTKIYDVSIPQVFKMKVRTSHTFSTNNLYNLQNIDVADYDWNKGHNHADNQISVEITDNMEDYFTGLDNGYDAVVNGVSGNGKSAYLLINGVLTSFDYLVTGGSLGVYTSGTLGLALNDIVEIYIADTPAVPYYVWGNDGTNGDGYYYPVYTTTTGLSSYHTHTIGGVDYYMEDSDQNHAQDNLPQNHTYALAPNTNEPTYNIGDLVVSTHMDGHGNANVEHDAIILNVKWANNRWQYDGKFMSVAPWNSCSTYQNYNDTYFSTTYGNGNPPNDHACFHT